MLFMQVSSLLYVPNRRYVLSTSWDGTICLQDESPQDEGKLLKLMHAGHDTDVTTAAISHVYRFLATGADDGLLRVWQMDERSIPHPHYELRGHHGVITALCFLEPWPLLASADSTGSVRIWSTKSSMPALRFRQLMTLSSRSAQEWSAPWMRVASVQLNSRNTDGTLSEAAERVATVRDMRADRWKEGERRKSPHFMKEAGVTSPSFSSRQAGLPRQGSSKYVDAAPLGAATSASPISRASASPISRSRERERERSHPPSPSPTHEARQQQHEGWHNASVLSSASSGIFMTEFGGGSVAGDAPDGAPSAPITEGACAVTALCFSADEHTLTWGDDSGRIVIWDLTSLLKLMPIPDIDERTCNHSKGAKWDPTGSGCTTHDFSTSGGIVVGAFGMAARPSARLRGGTRSESGGGARRGMDNLRESAWLLSKLQGTTVSIRHIWQAHSDAITSVIRIAHPPAIFSTSADRLATMWKYDGSECYGSLRRGGPLKGDALACFHQVPAYC